MHLNCEGLCELTPLPPPPIAEPDILCPHEGPSTGGAQSRASEERAPFSVITQNSVVLSEARRESWRKCVTQVGWAQDTSLKATVLLEK